MSIFMHMHMYRPIPGTQSNIIGVLLFQQSNTTFLEVTHSCYLYSSYQYSYPHIGEYHKFDTIAYPQSTKISKSFWKSAAYGVLSVVTLGHYGKSKDKEDDTQDSFTPLNHQDMSNFCLQHYLLRYEKMLCSGSFPDGVDIHTVARQISFIYHSLSSEYISHTDDPNSHPQRKTVDQRAFKEVK